MTEPTFEIRRQDGKLDEIVAEGVSFHMERMDRNRWWFAIYKGDERVAVWFSVANRLTLEVDGKMTRSGEMVSRSTSVCVDVDVDIDLDEFSTAEIIAELKDRKLTPKDICAIRQIINDDTIDFQELDIATAELTCGRRSEALVWLERALPRSWRGVLT
jgi:hypothetical protein